MYSLTYELKIKFPYNHDVYKNFPHVKNTDGRIQQIFTIICTVSLSNQPQVYKTSRMRGFLQCPISKKLKGKGEFSDWLDFITAIITIHRR